MRVKQTCALFLISLLFAPAAASTKDSEEKAAGQAEKKAVQDTKKSIEELSAERENKIENLFKEAIRDYNEGNFKRAEGIFRQILIVVPENETARSYLKKMQKAVKQKEKEDLRKLAAEKRQVLSKEKKKITTRSRKERLAVIHIRKGDGYYRSHKLSSAIKEWEKALSICPESEEAKSKLLKVKYEIEKKEKEAENEKLASTLIGRGRVFFKNGKYEEAINEWKKILDIVPGNHPDYQRAELWIHSAEVNKLRMEKRKAILKKDLSERTAIIGVSETWLLRQKEHKETGGEEKEGKAEGEITAKESEIEEKADQIVSVHFENAHIRSVLRYLSEVGGVNIVLDEQVFPEDAQVSEGQTSSRVTIDLDNLPLIQALEAILKGKILRYRLEKNLIWITTPERMAVERLETRIYTILTSGTRGVVFERPEEEEEGEKEGARRLGEEEEEEGGGTTAEAEGTLINTIEQVVPWPEGSYKKFDERTSTLIVRNTPTNLKILEALIRQIEEEPMQVSIEAKFVTISTNDLRQLGIQYPYLRIGLGSKGNVDVARDGAYGISFPYVTGEDDQFPQGKGITMSYTKFGPTQFQMIIDAMKGFASTNLLSSPKVMTKNQQEAEIKVVKEYRFPDDDSWETFYYLYRTQTGFNSQGATIVPTSFSEPTEIGIMLTVKPDIGTDRNITLQIRPIFNEFLGWTVYGAGVTGEDDEVNYVQFAKIYEQDIDTQIIVGHGETVVMGGLIKEKSGNTVKKVPFLGDIPILGRLFRRTATQSEKKSLLIFITTYLVKPTGERY